jgi:outer membrane protein
MASWAPRNLPAWRVRRSVRAAITVCVTLFAIALFAAAQPAAAETIEAALARAYASNPQLNAQRAIVRQTDEGVPQALSGYRPTITANATVGRQYTDTKELIPPSPPFLPTGASFADKGLTTPHSIGLTGSQTLFNGQQTANKVRAAESQVSAARETLRMMEQSVLLAAATVYMDMSRDSANLEVQQNNVRVLQRTLTDTNNRFTAGQVTSTDVAQSEAQLAAGESTMHAAE